MAHFIKLTRGAAQMTIAHDRRDKYGIRENIDESRTHLNYYFHDYDDENGKLTSLIDMSERSGAYMRNDMNVVCSVIITLPKNFPVPALEKEFFKGCYDFICDDFGKENILSAWVHKDEAQPHIHIKFCPITEKIKKGKTVYQFDAKNKVNREYLRTFHNRLQEHLTDYLGFTPSILNGATKDGNKTTEQLKNETYRNKCVSVYENNKKIIADFWEEYKDLSGTYWTEYKKRKYILQNEIMKYKKYNYCEEKEIEECLDIFCNLSHGLLYALFRLFCGILMMLEHKDEYNKINRLESELEHLESIRRRVSNYQHNTKNKLKKEDLEGIEEGLRNWENAIKDMNLFVCDYLEKELPTKKKEKSVDEQCR